MEIKSFHNIPLWFPTIVYFVNWEHSTMSKAFPNKSSFRILWVELFEFHNAKKRRTGRQSKLIEMFIIFSVGNICVTKLGSTWLLCLHSCSHTLVAKSPYEYQWVSFPPAHLLLLLRKFHPSLYLILDLYVITVLLLKRGRESSKLGSESNTNYNMLISTTCEKL